MRSHLSIWLCLLLLTFNPWSVMAQQDPFGEFRSADEEAFFDDPYQDMANDSESALRFDLLAQRQIADSERRNLVGNVAYGAGTGLMLGGWFTFLRPGTSREQFRTIGTSTVIGGLIGALIGSRSVWNPAAPRPQGVQNELPVGPVALVDPTGFRLAYTWTF